jgi:hypothetical protein
MFPEQIYLTPMPTPHPAMSSLYRSIDCADLISFDSSSTEEFSYFTLRRKETSTVPATSLFGIACSRQLDSSLLINRPPEVTRSTVQKAVVVVTDSPQRVGLLREKLSVVTSAWFAQRYVGCFFGAWTWWLCPVVDALYGLKVAMVWW